MHSSIQRTGWTFVRRVLLLYFCVLLFPFPLDSIPFTEGWDDAVEEAELRSGVWTARHVFRITRPLSTVGDGWGDFIGNYLGDLNLLAFAIVMAAVWWVVTRLESDVRWESRLRLYLRLALGGTMLGYGSIKVIPVQFGRFGLPYFAIPWGDMPQSWILWAFMAYSPTYTIFAGSVEVMAGILLFFRRTALLGTLLTLAAVTNVLMLDIGYGVHVKLFAANLVAASVFLLHYDARRLIDFFIRGRQTLPDMPVDDSPRQSRGTAIFATLLLVLLATLFARSLQRYRGFGTGVASRVGINGLYDVTNMQAEGKSVPLLQGNQGLWRSVVIQGSVAYVYPMSDSLEAFTLQVDGVRKELHLTHVDLDHDRQPLDSVTFVYAKPDASSLTLRGLLRGRDVVISLRRFDVTRYRLARAKFHWFDE